MKMKIDDIGLLHLERKSQLKKISCPFNHDSVCGDWCALFTDELVDSGKITLITLCHREYECKAKDFIDERKNDS